jgi:hypothetical protein
MLAEIEPTQVDITKAARSNLAAYAVFITDSKVLDALSQWHDRQGLMEIWRGVIWGIIEGERGGVP